MSDPFVLPNEWADSSPSNPLSRPSAPGTEADIVDNLPLEPELDSSRAWTSVPSRSPQPSSASLNPAEIAKKDHLDLSLSSPSSDHDEIDPYYNESPADLVMQPLPSSAEEADFRDFAIPEPLLTPAELKLRGYKWVTAKNGEIPENAVEGGYMERRGIFTGISREPLFVGRVKHGPTIVPGKASRVLGGCNYTLGDGVERVAKTYQVLTHPMDDPTHVWLPLPPAGGISTLRHLVDAEMHLGGGDRLAVARGRASDGVHPGFIVVEGSTKRVGDLIIAWGGKEIKLLEGEVLMIE